MKENYIEKIKKMGKIATVIVNIARVFVIIGMVGVIIAAVVFAVLPKDLCKVNVSGAAEVEVDLSKFGVKLRAHAPSLHIPDSKRKLEFKRKLSQFTGPNEQRAEYWMYYEIDVDIAA